MVEVCLQNDCKNKQVSPQGDECLGDFLHYYNVVEMPVAARLDNALQGMHAQAASGNSDGMQRIADIPPYFADAVVRRAPALQLTRDATAPGVSMHSEELKKLGMQTGDTVQVKQGQGSARLVVHADDHLPQGTARVAAGHSATAALGPMFGTLSVERA